MIVPFRKSISPPGGVHPLRVGVGALWCGVLPSFGWAVPLVRACVAPRSERTATLDLLPYGSFVRVRPPPVVE